MPTLTTFLSPRDAIHSRNADTAISLAKIINVGIATIAPYRPASNISDVLTISLSATGSKNAPTIINKLFIFYNNFDYYVCWLVYIEYSVAGKEKGKREFISDCDVVVESNACVTSIGLFCCKRDDGKKGK
jgi:hypothetical protein